MNTKLTLSLDKDIIEQAKIYAKEHNMSLSFIIKITCKKSFLSIPTNLFLKEVL